ncbi:uncharacterized protein LOC143253491 [Tachypleus tridentatus]|uniref:uncharacterized protein LOC143253491 n=1 Tax=Tachypleus tridentatus TaxID=6853 RepID=UPI003FD33B79
MYSNTLVLVSLFNLIASVPQPTGPNFDTVSGFGDPRIYNLVVCDPKLKDEVRWTRNQCFQDTKPKIMRDAELMCRQKSHPNLTDISFLDSLCSDNGTLTKMMWRCVYDEMIRQYPGVGSYIKDPAQESLNPSEIDLLHLLRTYLGYASFFQGFQSNRLYFRTGGTLPRALSSRHSKKLVGFPNARGNPPRTLASRHKKHVDFYTNGRRNTPFSKHTTDSFLFKLEHTARVKRSLTGDASHGSEVETYELKPRSYVATFGADYVNGQLPYTLEDLNYKGDSYGPYGYSYRSKQLNNNYHSYRSNGSSHEGHQSSDTYRTYGSSTSSYGSPQLSDSYLPYGFKDRSYGSPQSSDSYRPYGTEGRRYGSPQSSDSYRPYGSEGTSYGSPQSSDSYHPYGSGGTSYESPQSSDSYHPYGSGGTSYESPQLSNSFHSYGSEGTSYGSLQSSNSYHPYGSEGTSYGSQKSRSSYDSNGSKDLSHGGTRSSNSYGSYRSGNSGLVDQNPSEDNRPYGSSLEDKEKQVSGFRYGADRPLGSVDNYRGGRTYPSSNSHFTTGGGQYDYSRSTYLERRHGENSYAKQWLKYNRFNSSNSYRPQNRRNYHGDRRRVFPDMESNQFNLPDVLYHCLRNIMPTQRVKH